MGHWILEDTEQNLIKFILHLYHEVQSMFSALGDKIFPEKHFYRTFIFETQNRKWAKYRHIKKKKKKNVLNESFAHNLTRYHAQITTIFKQVDDLETIYKNFEKCKF